MSTQFENVRTQTSGIRAWGDIENGYVVMELRILASKNKKDVTENGLIVSESSEGSNIHISDVYQKREGEWLAQFGTIKSMTGLSNKQIPDILNRLQELGKFSPSGSKAQWENICISDGKVIFTEDLKNEKPKMIVVEGLPFTDIAEKRERIDLPQDTEEKPEEDQEFDEWLDDIIGIISEIANATPEQLQKLGQSLNLIGKELEDSGLDEEVDSLVETIESDEEDEMIEQCLQEIKNGNKPLINFFAGLTDKDDSKREQKQEEVKEKQVKVIETPVKPDESPIANRIMREAAEKISETSLVNEHQRHTDTIVDMVQKMQLMSTEDIEKLWDMWTRRQERLANQDKPKLIPKKFKPEPALSDNDWEGIDGSWEKDEKKYWKEIKELKEELEEMKEIEKKLEDTPPSKSWAPLHSANFHGDDTLSEEEIHQGQRRHRSFLDRIRDEMVFCEPMSWMETQKRWEKTWRDMGKEWQRHAMERRRREQEEMSRWELFYGMAGQTPPWSKVKPKRPRKSRG